MGARGQPGPPQEDPAPGVSHTYWFANVTRRPDVSVRTHPAVRPHRQGLHAHEPGRLLARLSFLQREVGTAAKWPHLLSWKEGDTQVATTAI